MTVPDSTQPSVSIGLRNKLTESGSLLGALDAITRWRPFALLGMTFLACAVIVSLFTGIGASLARQSIGVAAFTGFIGMLLASITALLGINGAGIMLSDDVWNRPQRGLKAAILVSLFTSHRLILILLLEGFMFLLYLIALAILFFLCKIPGIGPVLYAVAFPLGAILTGVVLFALVYVAIPLAAPAVWSGATVMNALAMLKEVARQRSLFVAIMTLLLGILLIFVGGIIGGIVGSGSAITLGVSASIVGASMDMTSFLGVFSGYGSNHASGYAWSLGFGAATLFLVATTPVLLVGIKGAAIIHQAAISGLSLDKAEEEINRGMAEVKKRAQEAKEQAKARIAAAQAAAQAAANVKSASAEQEAPAATSRPKCPSCSADISEADVFCGSCGHKLK